MLNANAKAWVAALRSGEYRQTKAMLHSERGGYCCLGVACELYGAEHGIGWEKSGRHEGLVFLGHDGSLPFDVLEWLGLKNEIGSFGDGNALTTLNDAGKRFKTIAKVIESEPPGLFKDSA